jgi:hypothetical protein
MNAKIKITYRDKEYSITIESIQINNRYPKIYRLNNDNNLAHRVDYFQFHDARNPENIHLTEDSIRFIQFPYSMQSLHSHCIIDDKVISDYLDFDYSEIKDGLIYPNQSSDEATSYVIAPKIPFTMLEEAGINMDKEIEIYVETIESGSIGTPLGSFDDDEKGC